MTFRIQKFSLTVDQKVGGFLFIKWSYFFYVVVIITTAMKLEVNDCIIDVLSLL
jgi:hypothetical protein